MIHTGLSRHNSIHPSTVNTATQFSNATNEMESFVAEALKNADIKSKVQVLV